MRQRCAEVVRRLLARAVPAAARAADHPPGRLPRPPDQRPGWTVHFFRTLVSRSSSIVLIASASSAPSSRPTSARSRAWATRSTGPITTVIGSGDSSYVTSPGGFVVGWLLAFFGVAIVAALTAAVVGFVIDFLLKEGQGMGASGYQDHIVVCGWNATARDLVEELKGDEFTSKIVVLHDADKNPAGDGHLLRARRRDQRRGPRAGRHQRGGLGDRLPGRRQQRVRHALDPDDPGHREHQPRRADRRRGQQPQARRPLQAGQGQRDPGDLTARLAAARPLRALPGPGRAWSPTSSPAATAPSSTT